MLWLLLNPQLQEPPPPKPAALVQLRASEQVQLIRNGEKATVSMQVPVPAERAWAVLTDYTRTFSAMPDVKAVSLVSRKGQQLRLRQVLKAPYTFGLSITALLEGKEDVKSRTLRYWLVQGDRISALSGDWTLTPVAGGTRIVHTIRLKPEVPPLLLPSFRSLHDASLQKNFKTLRQLMLAPA